MIFTKAVPLLDFVDDIDNDDDDDEAYTKLKTGPKLIDLKMNATKTKYMR